MLREDRGDLYFNLCLESGFYMEAEDGKNIFQRLIDRIKALIEKIKKFINEKILKKEIPKEVEVDEGIMAHIKKALGTIKKFLSNGFKFFATHKKIAAGVLAVVGIATVVDLSNGRNVKITRDNLNSVIKDSKTILDETEHNLKMASEMEEWLNTNPKDLNKKAADIMRDTVKTVKKEEPLRAMKAKKYKKKAEEELKELPKYGSILYAIAGYIQKVLTYLGSKIGKSKTEKKGE